MQPRPGSVFDEIDQWIYTDICPFVDKLIHPLHSYTRDHSLICRVVFDEPKYTYIVYFTLVPNQLSTGVPLTDYPDLFKIHPNDLIYMDCEGNTRKKHSKGSWCSTCNGGTPENSACIVIDQLLSHIFTFNEIAPANIIHIKQAKNSNEKIEKEIKHLRAMIESTDLYIKPGGIYDQKIVKVENKRKNLLDSIKRWNAEIKDLSE